MANAYQDYINQYTKGSAASPPAWATAADTQSIANGNKTFLESASDLTASIPKFIGVSLMSGVNELYNMPTNIGNLFGADLETRETEDFIANFGDNWVDYYKEYKEGADLAGFIVSSFIPGTAGVRFLNLGQKSLQTAIGAGKFSSGMGKALGLLAPNKPLHLGKALKEVATTGTATSLFQGNALKALASGAQQNFLEALAFEGMVAATMYSSPILEEQDFSDIAKNALFGAALFTGIGGAVDAASIKFAIRNKADAATIEAMPWTHIPEQHNITDPHAKIIMDLDTINNMPDIPTSFSPERQSILKNKAEATKAKLENRLRENFNDITGKDYEVSAVLTDNIKQLPFEEQVKFVTGLKETSRLTKDPKLIKEYEKLTEKVALGKATDEEMKKFLDSDIHEGTAKLWGENAGKISFEKPIITQLADTLKKGEKIEINKSRTKVTAGKKTFSFSLKEHTAKASGKSKNPFNLFKADKLTVNARYIWAQSIPDLKLSAKNKLYVDANDFPLLERAYQQYGEEALDYLQISGLPKGEDLSTIGLKDFIIRQKLEAANELMYRAGGAKPTATTQEEIAAIINVKNKVLSGELKTTTSADDFDISDFTALQSYAKEFSDKFADGKEVAIWNRPQHINVAYDTSNFIDLDGNVLKAVTIIKEQQRVYRQGMDRASATVLGDFFKQLPDIFSSDIKSKAKSSGAGPGFLSFSNGNYGSLASTVEYVGNVTNRAITKAKEAAELRLNAPLYNLRNNEKAAIEFSTLDANLRALETKYTLNDAGNAMVPLNLYKWEKMAKEAVDNGKEPPTRPVFDSRTPENIPIKNKETAEAIKAHIELNGKNVNNLATIRSAQGIELNRDPLEYYPIPVNPSDYQHFAIVIDNSITTGNHHRTIYATSEEELETMSNTLKSNPQLKVLFKRDAEEYYKSIGQYEYEKTINSNYLDMEVKRLGVSANYNPPTDPTLITQNVLKWHNAKAANIVREGVTAKYEVEFQELLRLGEEATNLQTSTFSNVSLAKFAESLSNNPFNDYIKTALNVSRHNDYPYWMNASTMLDRSVSTMFKRIHQAMAGEVSGASLDNKLNSVNNILKESGYQGVAYNADMQLFANSTVPKGALSTMIQKVNSMLATVVLRLDSINAVVNTVSANVLLGSETKAVIRAINSSNADAAGELAQLANIKVIGTDKTMLSAHKLIGNSMMKFNWNSPEFKMYRERGVLSSISDQYMKSIDDLTLTGKESFEEVNGILQRVSKGAEKFGNLGEKITGNKLAEEFNRFVAADVMKQITDVAVKHGVMDDKTAWAYINTFVNRTQGNYLAAQRPGVFSGAIGQAIGLFQTYQFNLLQQLLRYTGEGHAKDAATLLALQGTIHGMNGLPGFNAVNTHILGNASGNNEHKDAFTTVYGTAGKEAGDWLMYGLGSNMFGLIDPALKINLYTRGDINPRHVTILPTNPAEVPAIQATGRMLGNIFGTIGSLANGADVSTALLNGLEHNAVSRPLAGLAVALKGFNNPEQASYSTSSRGNVIAANDLLTLTNLTRLAGAKPLDEAIAQDTVYRTTAYQMKDNARRQVLGKAIKTELIAGKQPDAAKIDEFAQRYAEIGGDITGFNRWYTSLYKSANLSQANELADNLNSPYSKHMQIIMGGKPPRDFYGED